MKKINKKTIEEYIQKIDDIIFYEYDTKKTEVMLPCIFYKLTGKLWQSVYTITLHKYYECYTNFTKDNENDTYETKYIDKQKTHEKLINDGWIYKDIIYNDYYFKDNMILELEAVSCTLYLDNDDKDNIKIVKHIQSLLSENKNERVKEIGIATRTNTGYSTKYVEFDKMDIDVKKTYNDDIPLDRIDKFINDDSNGLALFYGEPGTGKSTFIKYLVQKYNNKNFIILDSDLLADITNKQLISYFIDEDNAIYIIEDAEKLLSSRDTSYNPIISSFLNMSDGILASAIKCKFICTFNTALSNIDKALQRKGRMKIKYEFGKLKYEKAKKINPKVKGDTAIAELFYDVENDFSKKETKKIGFN